MSSLRAVVIHGRSEARSAIGDVSRLAVAAKRLRAPSPIPITLLLRSRIIAMVMVSRRREKAGCSLDRDGWGLDGLNGDGKENQGARRRWLLAACRCDRADESVMVCPVCPRLNRNPVMCRLGPGRGWMNEGRHLSANNVNLLSSSNGITLGNGVETEFVFAAAGGAKTAPASSPPGANRDSCFPQHSMCTPSRER